MLAAALWVPFSRVGTAPHLMVPVLAGTATLGLVLLGYVSFYHFPPDVDADSYAEAVKNAWSLLGVTLGLAATWVADARYLHFPTKAPLWGQAVKLGLGIALLLGVLEGTKPLLSLLSGGAPWAHLVRYLLATLFAGIVWPLTFRFFERQEKSRGNAAR